MILQAKRYAKEIGQTLSGKIKKQVILHIVARLAIPEEVLTVHVLKGVIVKLSKSKGNDVTNKLNMFT